MLYKKNLKKLGLFLTLLVGFLFLVGCAKQPSSHTSTPGFFLGIVHGIIVPISFLGSIFKNIRIYAFPNSGFFYDFGFIIGLSILFDIIKSIDKK